MGGCLVTGSQALSLKGPSNEPSIKKSHQSSKYPRITQLLDEYIHEQSGKIGG